MGPLNAAIGVVVAAFLVFNTFTIVVAQRTRELGLLRVIGASRGQMVTALLLGLIGIRLLVILRHFTKSGDVFMKNLSQSALFMFVFYMLGGMTLTISTLSTMSWYLWILFGIVAYQHSLYRTQQREILREALVRS